jgi:hypothetical protein
MHGPSLTCIRPGSAPCSFTINSIAAPTMFNSLPFFPECTNPKLPTASSAKKTAQQSAT